jgi:ABC-type antimicrobial peptide transport system permease subunit
MLKSIFIQIWNRRRSNAWITVELVLVFILVWNMADYLFVFQYNRNIPSHRDVRNTWRITLGEYPDAYAGYRAEESAREARQANFTRILRALHDYPGIEAVAVMYSGSEPGSSSYSGTSARSPEDTAVYVAGQVISLDPEEDFFRVFAYTSAGGRQAVSVRDFDVLRPNAVVLGQTTADRLFPSGSATGREIHINGTDYTVAGVVGDIKRFDYTRPHGTYYVFPRRDTREVEYMKIAVRSSAADADSFRETFRREMTGRLQAGNFYLKNVVSYSKLAEDTDMAFGVSNDIREKVYLMIFFLLNILLCVTGTFWYRVNTRREEIGIRRAAGSSAAGVRRILLTEGLCLLVIAALPAMLIEYQFVRAGLIDTMGYDESTPGLYLPDRMHLRFLITNGITCAVMAAVILAAIWLPARKASVMPPAEALHYE